MGAFGNAFGDGLGSVRQVTLLNYSKQVISLFGDSIISYYPLDETSGTAMIDIVNGHNGTYGPVTLMSDKFKGKPSVKWGATSYSDISNVGMNFVNKNEGTVIFWAKNGALWNDNKNQVMFNLWSITGDYAINIIKAGAGSGNSIQAGFSIGGVPSAGVKFGQVKTNNWIMIAFSWSATNSRIRGYLNGAPFHMIPQQTPFNGGASGNFRVDLCGFGSSRGSGAFEPFLGNMSNLIILNREVTQGELQILCKCPQVIFDGDSRTAIKPYPGMTLGDNIFSIINTALSGSTVAAQTLTAPANVDAKFKQGEKNLCVILGGVNDASQGANAQTIYDRLKAYCLARKAAGIKVIVCSEIDAQSTLLNSVSWHTVIYPSLNALLRADHSFADGFADLGLNPNLQDANNLTYYLSDKLHLTDAGYAEIASVVAPIISSLL